jgi:hypothetical protein
VDPVTQPLTADGFLGPARVPPRGVTASSAGASIYAANSPVRPSLRIRTVITWTWPTLRRSTNRRRTRTALSPCRTIARTTSAVGRATRLNHRSHSDRPNGADAVVEDHPRRRAGLACIGRRCDPARMAAAVRAPSGAATHLRIIRASRHNKLSGSAEPPSPGSRRRGVPELRCAGVVHAIHIMTRSSAAERDLDPSRPAQAGARDPHVHGLRLLIRATGRAACDGPVCPVREAQVVLDRAAEPAPAGVELPAHSLVGADHRLEAGVSPTSRPSTSRRWNVVRMTRAYRRCRTDTLAMSPFMEPTGSGFSKSESLSPMFQASPAGSLQCARSALAGGTATMEAVAKVSRATSVRHSHAFRTGMRTVSPGALTGPHTRRSSRFGSR